MSAAFPSETAETPNPKGPERPVTGRVRLWLSVACALSSVAFAWVELRVAPHPRTTLGLACGALSALYAATAVCAVVAERWLARVWRLLAWTSLACALVFTGATTGASLELIEMYGPLGWGLSVLLAAITLLLLTATVPVALWWFWLARQRRVAG